MRTLKFSNVIYGVSQLAGLDRDNLPNHFFKQVRDLANTRLTLAWDSEYWPELIKTVSTPVTTTDSVSSMVYPATAGEILEVYDKNPAKTTALSAVSYVLRDDTSDSSDNSGRTINVFKSTSPLFIEYRIEQPSLTGDVWETGTTYNGTSSPVQVYHSGEGNFYSTVLSTTNEPDHEDWSKILMPKIFENYLIRGIYADYLRANGLLDAAGREEPNAEYMLILESDKLYRQQGQVRQTNMITY